MALMVPDSLPSRASQGEKTLYQVLSNKLSDDFYTWYEPIPHPQGCFPYFIILSPNFGLLILQVVGWFSHQILSADIHHFTIKSQTEKSESKSQTEKSDRTEVQSSPLPIVDRRTRKRSKVIEEVQPSPLQQGNSFLNQLLEKLQTYQILSQPNSEFQNKLVFPISVGIVIPNITAKQSYEKDIHNLLKEPQVSYRDEFLSWNDFSEADLVNRLKRMFTDRSDFLPLTDDQIETIKGVVHPEIAIKEVAASHRSIPDGVELREKSYAIRTLDHRQECIAKAIGGGHRIIYGVAGSGKTLILLCRAKLLVNQNPNQRILILCFNVCLARYLKSILHEDTQNSHCSRIDVFHFHGWASSLVKKLPARLPGLPVDYYDELMGEILLKKIISLPIHQKWDAVLVDEAQTFFPSWLKCCVTALKDSDNGNLMLVADGNQGLYKRSGFTWKSVGVKAVGRTTSKKYHLDKNYRNTQEILEGAWSVINHAQNQAGNIEPLDKSDTSEVQFPLVEPRAAMRQGNRPVLHIQQTKTQEVEAVIRQIQKVHQIGYLPNEIGVLYRIAGDDERRMLNELTNKIKGLGLESYWVTENRDSERSYSIHRPGIRIMSMLNSLGLEFKVVLILWVQDWYFSIPATSQTDVLTCRRLYVAMTRAQDLLHLFGSGNSPLLEELKRSLTFEIQQG